MEKSNNKLFRLFFKIIILIISFFGAGSEFEDFFSLKYNKGKIVLRIFSNNLEDEIDNRQLMNNPPYTIETIQSIDDFSYDIIYNGMFKGRFSEEENNIAGKERKKILI